MKTRNKLSHALSSAVFTLLAISNTPVLAVDMIVHNANITTFDGQTYQAAAIENGKFSQLSQDANTLLKQKTAQTIIIDGQGKRMIPGINDSHTHIVRGGRFYNLETRWEDITSLKEGLALIKQNAKVTPKGHWVRVIGGFSPYRFAEKRLPTPQELTEAAPDTPVFVLHLYSGGVLNKKAMEVLAINKNTKAPKGSYYERDSQGNPTGRLVASPNPMILYRTIAALPHMSNNEQLNSSQQYYHKLLSYGLTSALDAGGGGHDFPENYQAATQLAAQGELPIRISNYLFPQQPSEELNDFIKWMDNYQNNQNLHTHLDNGYVIEGGGELLAYKASDYENFTAKRPELASDAEKDLEQVVRLHLLKKWPFRLHATYNESIERMLDLFEIINQTQPLNTVRWILDHAETISDKNLARVKKLGGAIAIQGRMAFAGEDFLDRYGKAQTMRTPPIKKMLNLNIPVGLGTDGTRVSSFNPWPTYYWAVSGKTVGGTQLYDDSNTLDRLSALKLFTQGSAYLSGEESVKGDIQIGMYADFALLNHDILSVQADKLLNTKAHLTVVDGKIRYADQQAYPQFVKPLPAAIPAWSPVNQN